MNDNYSFRDTLIKWEHISGLSGREICRRSDIPYTTYCPYCGKEIDFAKEVVEKIKLVESYQSDNRGFESDYAYDSGVEWAISEALRIINEMAGDY